MWCSIVYCVLLQRSLRRSMPVSDELQNVIFKWASRTLSLPQLVVLAGTHRSTSEALSSMARTLSTLGGRPETPVYNLTSEFVFLFSILITLRRTMIELAVKCALARRILTNQKPQHPFQVRHRVPTSTASTRNTWTSPSAPIFSDIRSRIRWSSSTESRTWG